LPITWVELSRLYLEFNFCLFFNTGAEIDREDLSNVYGLLRVSAIKYIEDRYPENLHNQMENSP